MRTLAATPLPTFQDISGLLRASTEIMDRAESVRIMDGEHAAAPLYARARELRMRANAKLRERIAAKQMGIPFPGGYFLD